MSPSPSATYLIAKLMEDLTFSYKEAVTLNAVG